jgi:PAS domain S-box-containing protein
MQESYLAPALSGLGAIMSNQKRKLDISAFFVEGSARLPASFPKDVQAWKQELVNGILRSTLVVSILSLIGNSYYAYSIGAVWLIPLYTVLVGLWVLMTFLPRVPYVLRAWSPLILIYAVSILDLFESGPAGSARVFLIALPVLSLLLFDLRAGVLVMGISLLTLAGFGWLYATARLFVSPVVANSADPAIWLIYAVVFFFTTVLLMASANYLINRLVKAVIKLEVSVKETEGLVSLQQAVFDSTADGILAVDRTGKIITSNRKFVEMWDIPESAIMSRNDEAAIVSVLEQLEDPQSFTARIKELYEHPQDESDDILKLKDGRILERYSKPQRLGDEIVGRVWVFKDITARKQAEETLRESEKQYRSVIENIQDVFYRSDIQGRLLMGSPSGVRMFGYDTVDEMIGLPLDSFWPDPRERERLLTQMRITGSVKDLEAVLKKRDGATFNASFTAHFLCDEHGKLLGTEGIIRDITERKRAEEALKQYAEQAQRRAEQLATMNEIGRAVSTLQGLDSVMEIIYRQVQRIAPVDAFYVGLYDPEHEQVTFPLMYDMGSRYSEPALPLAEAPWMAHVIHTGKPFMLHRTVEDLQTPFLGGIGNVQRKSASILIVPLWRGERVMGVLSVQSYTLNAYTDEHAEILTGIGHQAAIAIENAQLYEQAQQEIAERRRVQAEREQLIAELEAQNAELERFAYTVSHDLKTPLVTIRGFLGLVDKDAREGNVERLKTDMARITEATDKMQRLLSELLELSRIGRLMNPPQAMPFEAIVREAVGLVRGRIEVRGVQVDIASNLPTVYGDRARLVEVVQNLMDNAAKFMGDQSNPRIEIGQRGFDADGRPVLFVRDNGIGIEPQYHERVFGLFNKLDTQSEGTGVGLALVKRIVEVHGGRIWVESEGMGKGSTFYFTIPANDSDRS